MDELNSVVHDFTRVELKLEESFNKLDYYGLLGSPGDDSPRALDSIEHVDDAANFKLQLKQLQRLNVI